MVVVFVVVLVIVVVVMVVVAAAFVLPVAGCLRCIKLHLLFDFCSCSWCSYAYAALVDVLQFVSLLSAMVLLLPSVITSSTIHAKATR